MLSKSVVAILILLTFTALAEAQDVSHVFPEIADGYFGDGSGYKSTIMVQNASASNAATCNLRVYGLNLDLGTPGFTTTSGSLNSLSINVPADGWYTARTTGAQPFHAGYATLVCSASVYAQVLYSLYVGGSGTTVGPIKLAEATVFSSPPSSRAYLIADQTEGARLGIAIANNTDLSRIYRITMSNTLGSAVATGTLAVSARSSLAKFLDEIGTSSSNQLLRVTVESIDSSEFSAIGLRFTGSTFATIPASPATTATPMVTSITPSTGIAGSTATVTLTGTNFIIGVTTVQVSGTGISVGSIQAGGTTSLMVSFTIASTATVGSYSVTVTTTGGTSNGVTFTVSAPPNSAPATIALSGTGQTATQQFSLNAGLSIFRLTHSGRSNFIVHLLDNRGNIVAFLANQIGSFSGSVPFGVASASNYLLDIQADGAWTATIEQPRPTSAQTKPVTFSGSGRSVSGFVQLTAGLTTFEMQHGGASNFIVHLLDSSGNITEFLANKIGSFSGSSAVGIARSGIYLLDITADGSWSITIR